MTCTSCKKREVFLDSSHTQDKLCRQCFLRLFEKRVKRNLRANGIIVPGARLCLVGDENREKLAHFILTRLYDLDQLTVVFVQENKGQDCVRIFLNTVDERDVVFLSSLFSGGGFESGFSLFQDISYEDLAAYGKVKGIEVNPAVFTGIDAGSQAFLSRLEKQYPGTIFSLARGSTMFKKDM